MLVLSSLQTDDSPSLPISITQSSAVIFRQPGVHTDEPCLPSSDPPSSAYSHYAVIDVGVSRTHGYLIMAGVPLALLLMCCCAGACFAKHKKKSQIPPAGGVRDMRMHTPGGRSATFSAAPIAPASRSHSSAELYTAGGSPWSKSQANANMFCATVGPDGKKNSGE